jgi:tRNA A37 threonylcarbamoyladenosine dehydratase
MTTLDVSYRDALPLLVKATRQVHVMLVGCGGSGSWLAPDLARLACALKRTDRQMDLTFVDPDVVEERNVYRQNFCFAETGRAKALALAMRYSAAWGVEIRAVAEPFDPGRVRIEWDALTVLVGCVDNATARKSISETLKHNQDVPQTWWLDVVRFVPSKLTI